MTKKEFTTKQIAIAAIIAIAIVSGVIIFSVVGCSDRARLPSSLRMGFNAGHPRENGVVVAIETDNVIFDKENVFIDVSFGYWESGLFRQHNSRERFEPLYIGLYVGLHDSSLSGSGQHLPSDLLCDNWKQLQKVSVDEFMSEKYFVTSQNRGCAGRELVFEHTQRVQIPASLFDTYTMVTAPNSCRYNCDCFQLVGGFMVAIVFVVRCVQHSEIIVYSGEKLHLSMKQRVM